MLSGQGTMNIHAPYLQTLQMYYWKIAWSCSLDHFFSIFRIQRKNSAQNAHSRAHSLSYIALDGYNKNQN